VGNHVAELNLDTLEELRLHVDLTELGHTTAELEQ